MNGNVTMLQRILVAEGVFIKDYKDYNDTRCWGNTENNPIETWELNSSLTIALIFALWIWYKLAIMIERFGCFVALDTCCWGLKATKIQADRGKDK